MAGMFAQEPPPYGARFIEELSRAKLDAFVVDFDDLERELRLG
jgi:hypothetical protein